MIVAMKKITLVTQAKDAQSALGRLRKLGLLHIEHTQAPQGKDITALSDEILLADQAIHILGSIFPEAKQDLFSPEPADWKKIATHIVDTKKRQEQIKEYGVTLTREINKWKDWGDFEPEAVAQLARKNIFVKFYQIPAKALKALKGNFLLKVISREDDTLNCVIVAQGEIKLSYKELELPKMSLAAMQRRIEEDQRVGVALQEELRRNIVYYQELRSARKLLEEELEFHQALRGMGEEAGLAYIKGFAPQDAQAVLVSAAKEEKWAIAITDPSLQDNVPTLLRNPRWVALISPLFKFLEILPGYSELDISLPFLLFFSLFFGILIGDAGYGLSYLLITFLIQRKLAKKGISPASFYLFYLLSFCAIIIGVLTGTFFGQEWLVKSGIKPLAPALTNPHTVQAICFFIGALHLTIAHGWRFILKLPSLEAWADIGWTAILWTGFFLARTLILGDSFPYFGKWLLIAGVSLVLLFTSPQKNILKGLGAGLGTLALSLMNNFTDVVSYIRLFAVGLAGVAIADAFNAMAAMVGFKNVLTIIVSGLILLIGHALGIVLGPVSVLVHGVRLNVLEFSGHANVSWSGFRYQPFKEEGRKNGDRAISAV